MDSEAGRCLLPSDRAQNDPDPLVEIENEDPDQVPIPVWLRLLEVEVAAPLGESE
jgi:hypothetical protein